MYLCIEIESIINPSLVSCFYYDAGKETTYEEAVEDVFAWYYKARPNCNIKCIYEIAKSLYVSREKQNSYREGIRVLKEKEKLFLKELKKRVG